MSQVQTSFVLVILAAGLASCSHARAPEAAPEKLSSHIEEQSETTNVLLAEWTGPYGGVPAFDQMDLGTLEPAMASAMQTHLVEIERIATSPDAPTFENTIVAMERVGRDLDRVWVYWSIWSSNMSSPEFRELQAELAPRISEHSSRTLQNEKLFARVEAVYQSAELKNRDPAEQRLVKLVYEGLTRNGATLRGEQKERHVEINKRLEQLHSKFANNVLADEEKYVLYVKEGQLGGLPDSFKGASASAAAARGHRGEWAILNIESFMDPFLTYSDERELREKVWQNYYNRGDNGDDHDNNEIIAEILKLRHERVRLLGYPNYAQWQLENSMARTPERAIGLMEEVWPAAVARVNKEVAEMRKLARREGAKIEIEPWDYRYYAEKVRKDRYDLDSNEVKQYLQLDKLREAMFMVALELFNFQFKPVPEGSVPVFHPDVKVWEVTDKTSGEHVGLWYLDPFARPGKSSGAWADSDRGHETFDGNKTVLCSNSSNFIKGAQGARAFVSWDDARTLFHEFGHALHELASNVAYPTLNSVVADYIEFHSQLLERWLLTDKVIEGYLVHHETGKPMPKELVAKLKTASAFNSGSTVTQYLASAIMDMRLHMMDPEGLDADAFERATLEELGLPRGLTMRHRSPHFGHIFSDEGYSAGYYGYLWADVLTADAAEAFAEAKGGYYDQDWAKKLVEHLFAPRNSVDPAEAYRAFRGRDASVDALMRSLGLVRK